MVLTVSDKENRSNTGTHTIQKKSTVRSNSKKDGTHKKKNPFELDLGEGETRTITVRITGPKERITEAIKKLNRRFNSIKNPPPARKASSRSQQTQTEKKDSDEISERCHQRCDRQLGYRSKNKALTRTEVQGKDMIGLKFESKGQVVALVDVLLKSVADVGANDRKNLGISGKRKVKMDSLNIWVHKSYRGQGLCPFVVQKMVERWKKHDSTSNYLLIEPTDARMLRGNIADVDAKQFEEGGEFSPDTKKTLQRQKCLLQERGNSSPRAGSL